MDGKINLDLISLKFVFNRNKPYIFSAVIILISIILFFQFVIPEFNGLIKARKEAKELSARLVTLNKSLNVLTNVNNEELDSQFNTLISALPTNKDVVRILNSINYAASKTGAIFGSFSFRVGDINVSEKGENVPVVKISVPIKADTKIISSFIEILSKTVPLSEINSVKINNASSMVVLSFYYRPMGDADYNQDTVNPVSQKGISFIDRMAKFDNPSFPQLQETANISSSEAKLNQVEAL